uniref:Uncharacterized protein n=1 Tax=Sphaerodactylus townsendi TaxID=933632 RepID=A0ACB8F0X4_9SAUR
MEMVVAELETVVELVGQEIQKAELVGPVSPMVSVAQEYQLVEPVALQLVELVALHWRHHPAALDVVLPVLHLRLAQPHQPELLLGDHQPQPRQQVAVSSQIILNNCAEPTPSMAGSKGNHTTSNSGWDTNDGGNSGAHQKPPLKDIFTLAPDRGPKISAGSYG